MVPINYYKKRRSKACSYRVSNWGKNTCYHISMAVAGSCWQLSLYQPAIQGKNKPFEWLGRVISLNRIFPAVSEKMHSHAKKHMRMFFTSLPIMRSSTKLCNNQLVN